MILIDAGPIVALLDADDPNHAACVEAVSQFPKNPFLTTWPCFTEAMYLLGRTGGYQYQDLLWRLWSDDRIIFADLTVEEIDQMSIFMNRYKNVPMDLADASLVVMAESRPSARILTLDSDFFIYRAANGSVLDVIHCSP